MLRITRRGEGGPDPLTLDLEGRLVEDWVPVLEQECLTVLARGGSVEVDFSEVSRIDARGADAVRRLASRGVRIVNCPEVIRDVLRDA